jgi:tetratricopeptide (TPR) repeat protein
VRGRSARVGLAAAVTIGFALTGLFGGVLQSSPPAQVQARVAAPLRSADTPAVVDDLQRHLRRAPADVAALGRLGLAYQQRARETGDPAYYTKSEGVLRRALALAPGDLLATSGLASLALSRHRFGQALRLGRRAVAISPTTARNQGVVGDALLELGRYRQAFRAFDRLAAMQPGLNAYARIAHARDLLGRTRGAVAAFRMALDAAQGQVEPQAWTRVQLGKLLFSRGRVAKAAAQYRAALAAFPRYAPALDALALAEWAQGRMARAIALARRAVDAIPLPQYVAQLGDLERASGDRRGARAQYALIGAIGRLLAANGVRTDLETALFRADHAVGRAAPVALARRARRQRPSIDGDDVLAWALQRAGRCREALGYSRSALRLGTLDALKFFHRAMIERCLGNDAAARAWGRRAVRLNPWFSVLWAPPARSFW